LTAFDPLGDRHLAFARKEWNNAHLAQVQTHRVICLFECTCGEIEFYIFIKVFLFIFRNYNSCLFE
jgi:hypothetical protein